MKLKDPIYGEFEIKEQVLLELIDSKPVQRLKNILQQCIPKEFQRFPSFSRYDHSLGVMLLLRRLGASVEEQAAGLLHDVSHTAFSHMIDMLLENNTKQDFQDTNHEKIIMDSELPQLLKKYGFDAKRIVEHHNYSLLEQETPSLCADRIDYALKDIYHWAQPDIVNKCVKSLLQHQGRIVFSSEEVAKLFALGYAKCQHERWGNADENIRVFVFVQALKLALKEKIITFDDFYKDDSYIMNALKKAKNLEITQILDRLKGEIRYNLVKANPRFKIKNKFRYIDPEFLKAGKMLKLSDVDAPYKELLEQQRKEHEKGINFNLLD